jgi:hypothetical protein
MEEAPRPQADEGTFPNASSLHEPPSNALCGEEATDEGGTRYRKLAFIRRLK